MISTSTKVFLVSVRRILSAALLGWLALLYAPSGMAQPGPTLEVNIPAQPMEVTLRQLSDKHKLQIGFNPGDVRGIMAPEVKGRFTVDALLRRITEGTSLSYSFNGQDTVVIKPGADASDRTRGKTSAAEPTITIAMPQIMVEGARTLNVDIPRSRDEIYPYVVFQREQIAESGATNLEDFFKTRLPMNTTGVLTSQVGTPNGDQSSVNLRGLGTNQTLILIDGRRIAGVNSNGSLNQPSINGIPLRAIERVEVLPTTASGIYGGGATGGVINIILKRDYKGVDAGATFESPFETTAALRRVDLSAGFELGGGKTNVMIAASYADQDAIFVRDRDFYRHGRETILANNPSFFFAASTPPLGGTTNIRSANGTNLVLRTGVRLNSPITSVPPGYQGPSTDRGAALVANAGTYNFSLADSAQVVGGKQSLINNPTTESGILTIRHDFSPAVSGFVETGGSNNTAHFSSSLLTSTFTIPATAPTNPFTEAIVVTVPSSAGDAELISRTSIDRFTAGFVVKLPRSWRSEADYTWSRSRVRYHYSNPTNLIAAGTTAVGTGALDVLRDTSVFPVDFGPFLARYQSSTFATRMNDISLRASGPLWALPAGPIFVSSLLEWRDERLSEGLQDTGRARFFYPGRSQSVASAYAEAKIPLASSAAHGWLGDIELQAAMRRDEYEVNGVTGLINLDAPVVPPIIRVRNKTTSTNPTLGVMWRPIPAVTLRASYGTGFLPPAVTQLAPNAPLPTSGGVDPRRGNTAIGSFQQTQGGNPTLQPEESKSESVGLVFAPSFLPGLRVSTDYVRIRKKDNIVSLSSQQLLDNEALFSDRIVRGPNLPGDPAGWAGPVQAIDATAVNIARANVEAYDFAVEYYYDDPNIGKLGFFLVATWHKHHQTQLLPSEPFTENVGITAAFPLKLKGNAGFKWSNRAWTLGLTTRYFDSYFVADPNSVASTATFLNQGGRKVRSQLYHDVFFRYAISQRKGKGNRLFPGLEIEGGIKNVLNSKPPFDARTFDSFYSRFGDPKLVTYYFGIRGAW